MQKIKLALKVFNSKSHGEKILVKVGNESISDISREKQLDPLIQIFRNAETSTGENIYDIFNHHLRNCRSWLPTMKLLYIAHELINNIGQRFCTSFLVEHFENIVDLVKSQNEKSDVEDYCHTILAANYYNFLIIYAQYFPDIHTHLSRDAHDLAKSLQQKQYTDLVQLVTFKNLIKYFTKVEESIEGSRSVLKDRGLIDKISLILFRDVITIYNLISANLKYSMNYIFELESGRALLLDELYSDTIQLTNKLRQMIDKAGLKGTNAIPIVHYFTFDPEFNKQEELYILELKKKKTKGDDDTIPYKVYMMQYQTLAPGKKKYKLNSGVGQLTRVTETARGKSKNYFNLDDDSFSPIKMDDEQVKYRNNSDANELLPKEYSSPTTYKDVKPLQLEIQLARNKSGGGGIDSPHYYLKKDKDVDLMMDYDPEIGHNRKEPNSVIFSPTSKSGPSGFNEEGSPDSLLKKDVNRLFNSTKGSGKKMNVNPANF